MGRTGVLSDLLRVEVALVRVRLELLLLQNDLCGVTRAYWTAFWGQNRGVVHQQVCITIEVVGSQLYNYLVPAALYQEVIMPTDVVRLVEFWAG